MLSKVYTVRRLHGASGDRCHHDRLDSMECLRSILLHPDQSSDL